MGEVVGAGILAHVPTIMLPRETRLALNEGKEISLVPGLHRLREEVFETLDYDTVVVLDSHWFTTVEFVLTAQDRRAGLFTAEELPRGMCRIPYDWRGDPELAYAMEAAAPAHSTWVTAIDDPYLPMYYATLNLWKFLGEGLDKRWISVSVAQTGVTEDFLRAGRALGDAISSTDRKVLIVASGALSHTFWKLRELRDHEAGDPSHIRTPEAYAADLERIDWFKNGEHAKVLDTMDDFLRFRPEAMFAHYLIMAGALGEGDLRATARQYGEYENSIGTGQVHLWFDRPDDGFPGTHPTPPDPDYTRQTSGPDLPAAG
jgi:3,4-dihydroxyphenylacetate 2,3-dioxygenase